MAKSADPLIPVKEYADRRAALMRAIGDGVGLVFAGAPADPLHQDFRPHPHFEYLTGIVDEPNAVLMLDPQNPQDSRRAVLYLRPLNPELEQWDGLRERIGSTLREQYGVTSIFRLGQFGRFLNEAARRTRRLVCLHPFANHDQPVSPDLAVFRSVLERIPGVTIEDATDAIASLRAVKSTHELAVMQHAIDISIASYLELMPNIAPGQSEFDIQELLEHGYRTRGSRGPAYGSIVGSSINSTVLHYRANRRTVEDGDLICIDSGAGYGGYGADITRTFPANGTFTPRQREVYDVVLAALNAATEAVKPGVTLGELDTVARKIITSAGYGDYFIHSIGHHLGLETHDVTPVGPLEAGNVITVEPGIYIPEEAIGIRLEDVVLVTNDGSRNLSAKLPRTADAIEKAMKN